MNASIHQAILIYLGVINEATKPRKNLYTLSLDMAKAYDSVSLTRLRKTLKKYEFPANTIDLVNEIYKNNTAELYTPIKKTKEDLKIESGVKQGCGLSPFLWVIYINPVLTKLEELKTNFRGAVDVSHITYIDDITIVTKSRKEMEMAIIKVETSLKKRGLKINAKRQSLPQKITSQEKGSPLGEER
jgi:hypothetical protein